MPTCVRVFAILLPLAFATSGSAATQPRARPAAATAGPTYTTAQVLAFDIAGIKLMMGPADVRRELQSHGYTKGETHKLGVSWQNAVMQEVKQRRHEPFGCCSDLGWYTGPSPTGDIITIWFAPDRNTPEGVSVKSVEISFAGNIDQAALNRALVTKYGQPSTGNIDTKGLIDILYWGHKLNSFTMASPHLSLTNHSSIKLDGGTFIDDKVKAEVTAEANRIQPLITKPNF